MCQKAEVSLLLQWFIAGRFEGEVYGKPVGLYEQGCEKGLELLGTDWEEETKPIQVNGSFTAVYFW